MSILYRIFITNGTMVLKHKSNIIKYNEYAFNMTDRTINIIFRLEATVLVTIRLRK